jgi:hypothetical protein
MWVSSLWKYSSSSHCNIFIVLDNNILNKSTLIVLEHHYPLKIVNNSNKYFPCKCQSPIPHPTLPLQTINRYECLYWSPTLSQTQSIRFYFTGTRRRPPLSWSGFVGHSVSYVSIVGRSRRCLLRWDWMFSRTISWFLPFQPREKWKSWFHGRMWN